MTEVTVVLKLRVADDACLVDWLPQLITDALEAEVGEELLSYDDTERFWPVGELANASGVALDPGRPEAL